MVPLQLGLSLGLGPGILLLVLIFCLWHRKNKKSISLDDATAERGAEYDAESAGARAPRERYRDEPDDVEEDGGSFKPLEAAGPSSQRPSDDRTTGPAVSDAPAGGDSIKAKFPQPEDPNYKHLINRLSSTLSPRSSDFEEISKPTYTVTRPGGAPPRDVSYPPP